MCWSEPLQQLEDSDCTAAPALNTARLQGQLCEGLLAQGPCHPAFFAWAKPPAFCLWVPDRPPPTATPGRPRRPRSRACPVSPQPFRPSSPETFSRYLLAALAPSALRWPGLLEILELGPPLGRLAALQAGVTSTPQGRLPKRVTVAATSAPLLLLALPYLLRYAQRFAPVPGGAVNTSALVALGCSGGPGGFRRGLALGAGANATGRPPAQRRRPGRCPPEDPPRPRPPHPAAPWITSGQGSNPHGRQALVNSQGLSLPAGNRRRPIPPAIPGDPGPPGRWARRHHVHLPGRRHGGSKLTLPARLGSAAKRQALAAWGPKVTLG